MKKSQLGQVFDNRPVFKKGVLQTEQFPFA